LFRLVGQNIYPVDPEQSRDTNLYFKNKEIKDTQAYYRKKIREAELRNDEDAIIKLEQEAEQRINLLADKLIEYEAQSKIPERLKRTPEEIRE
jgi:biopolymer transport protein ExbD